MLGYIQNRVVDCRTARTDTKARDTTFEFRRALLQNVDRRIHDARVNISRNHEVEQVRAVLRVIEFIRDRLVYRYSHRLGRRV